MQRPRESGETEATELGSGPAPSLPTFRPGTDKPADTAQVSPVNIIFNDDTGCYQAAANASGCRTALVPVPW